MDAATVSDDHAVTVDPLAADQIEIFRGPTTLLYGSGVVGGVINTVTTRIPMRAPEDGFAGAFELKGDLRLYGDYVHGELTTGEKVPRLPPLRYGARVQYHNQRLLAGLEATRYAEQDETAPLETVTPGYTLVNADVRWRFATEKGAELEVFVNAANLGDEEARKHTSFVKSLAPLPGRNFAMGVRSRF
jgi:outer membrane receptor protein involved in Fe transport